MPYVVCVLVLYSILVLGFTMGAGGEPDGGTGSDIGVKYNVVSENLKILSVSTRPLCSHFTRTHDLTNVHLSVHNALSRCLP
jgi:hypothetical protein